MPHFEFIQKKMTKYGGEWGGVYDNICGGGGLPNGGGSHFGGGGN